MYAYNIRYDQIFHFTLDKRVLFIAEWHDDVHQNSADQSQAELGRCHNYRSSVLFIKLKFYAFWLFKIRGKWTWKYKILNIKRASKENQAIKRRLYMNYEEKNIHKYLKSISRNKNSLIIV